MMEGRAPDQNQWMKKTVALMDAAMLAVEAARAKNVEKMGDEVPTIASASDDTWTMNR